MGRDRKQIVGTQAEVQPLLIRAGEAARALGISRASFYKLRASGRLPLPVRLGRSKLWRVEELKDWTDAGCPEREKWESMK